MNVLNETSCWLNVWMKVIPKNYDEWKLLDSHNFDVQLHPQKKVSNAKLKGATLQM
jgi:hypothetical protein